MLLDYLGEKNSAHAVDKAVFRVLKEKQSLDLRLGGKAKTSEVSDAMRAHLQQF